MDPKSNRVGTGLVGAPACGDVMKLQIEVLIKTTKMYHHVNDVTEG